MAKPQDGHDRDDQDHGPGQEPQQSPNRGFSSADPPRAPKGLSTNLQPGGSRPGGGPAASAGGIRTGGGQNQDKLTGSLKRGGD